MCLTSSLCFLLEILFGTLLVVVCWPRSRLWEVSGCFRVSPNLALTKPPETLVVGPFFLRGAPLSFDHPKHAFSRRLSRLRGKLARKTGPGPGQGQKASDSKESCRVPSVFQAFGSDGLGVAIGALSRRFFIGWEDSRTKIDKTEKKGYQLLLTSNYWRA